MEEELIQEPQAASFVSATRARVLPVIVLPVTLGAVYAWLIDDRFSLLWFAVTLVGASAMHLAANVINDVFDIKSGADDRAEERTDSIRTGSPFATPALATGLLILGGACGVVLTIYRGPLVLFYGIAGGFLMFAYSSPPLSWGYKGKGLGELAILLSFGPLPVAGSYYVQVAENLGSHTGPLSGGLLGVPLFVWFVSLLPGLLTMLLLFHHHFLHFEADRDVDKMTLVARWGPHKALSYSRPALYLAAILILVMLALRLLPIWGVFALAPLLLTWTAIGRATKARDLESYLVLLRATAATSLACQAVIILAALLAF